MKLEFRVPVSPAPRFYSQVRLLAQSLARLGAPYAEAKIHVSVGELPDERDVAAANSWAAAYPVEWCVVPGEVHAQVPGPWWASGQGRYACASDADIVILCDADICPVARFDELLAELDQPQAVVAGLQAHGTPFRNADNDGLWRMLLEAADAGEAELRSHYSLDVARVQGFAPAYFNYGFVAFNAAAFRSIAPLVAPMLRLVCARLPENRFAAQIALALAVAKLGPRVVPLGHELNCANDDRLLAHDLVRMDDVRVIHYLRGAEFDRHDFLCVVERFAAFVGSEKRNPISERLRQHVLGLEAPFIDWALGGK
jgi:hypothetical protein